MNGNVFSLVRTPDQATLDDPTNAPVEEFSSGFVGWTIDAIGTYFNQRCEREFPNGEGTHKWSTMTFTILDERSLTDKTVTIATWWATVPEEFKEDIDHFDDHATYGWHTVRVKFPEASHVAAAMDFQTGLYLEELSEDEDGVLKLPED